MVAAALPQPLRIGCAGWSLPGALRDEFRGPGSQLERYAGRFTAVEINSSFYRPHRHDTYARWAETTPHGFRFCVKVPKTVTHEMRLADAMPAFDEFLLQSSALGTKLGCLLAQLPPSLAFDESQVRRFASDLRARHDGPVALEARHSSWFTASVERVLAGFRIGRVLADPVLYPDAAAPGGWPGLVYLRLHGSPRRYWSSYEDELLQRLARRLLIAQEDGAECWCIFDNTASGAAVANALGLMQMTNSLRGSAPT